MQNDNLLMEKVKSGDRSAYDEIVIFNRKAAIMFAFSITSDYDISEDIVQDAFVKVYLLRHEYKPDFTFKTYLYTIIRNMCIDSLRKVDNKNSQLYENTYSNISVEEEIIYEERMKEIAELFNNLNGDYRTSLYLYAINGCSYKEISTIMGKTVTQVKITIHRARKKLKKSLESTK